MFQTMDDHPVLVTKGIYIGSFMAEHNKASLKSAGITHILQVRESPMGPVLTASQCLPPHRCCSACLRMLSML